MNLSPDASRVRAFTVTLAMAVGVATGGWVSDPLCRWLGHRAGCLVDMQACDLPSPVEI